MRRRNQTLMRIGFALLAIVLVAALVLPVAGSAFGATAGTAGRPIPPAGSPAAGARITVDPAATPTAPDDDLPDAPGSVVLVGTGGVRWEDLSAIATPALWQLAERGATANLVVRSVRPSTCPADGWLAVSAGRRAADLQAADPAVCRDLTDPDDGAVPGWSDYRTAATESSYDAQVGLLGRLLETNGLGSTAVGPGAAVALSAPDGDVTGRYLPRPATSGLSATVADAVVGSRLVVVDVGVVRDPDSPLVAADDRRFTGPVADSPSEPVGTPLTEPDRTEQVTAVDERIGAVVDGLRPQDTLVVAALADPGTEPLMQLGVLAGPNLPAGLLGSRSTRQPGMVQGTDVLPTLLDLLDVSAPTGLAGAPMTPEAGGPSGAARIADLADVNQHAVAVRPLTAPFFSGLILLNLLLYAVVTVGLNRRFLDRLSEWLTRHGASPSRTLARLPEAVDAARAMRRLRAVAVTVAAVPVANYLANLLPWWRTGSPGLVVYTATVAIAALIAGLALARPWRDRILAPMAVVAGLTTLVLALDVVTGARLQLASLMGVQPQVGGRFYGFNNSSFALWATATVLLATCVAEPLVRRGRRGLAAVVVAAIGLVATALNGLPTIGADFGGPPALVPGFAVLVLLTLGIRLTWRRMVAVVGVATIVALSFSIVDWLRPPAERSHLGRFIETVLDGGLNDVLLRKAGQNLANLFGSTLTLLAVGGIALVVVVLTRPLRKAARNEDHAAYGWLAEDSSLHRLDGDARMLRPGLVALGVTLGIGFAINDSGIVIPAIGVAMAVPLLIAVLSGWLLHLRGMQQPATAGPDAPEGAAPSRPSAEKSDGSTDPQSGAAAPGAAAPGVSAAGATSSPRSAGER